MVRLNLSVDGRVVLLAKQYAKRRGVSVSKLVEAYLTAVVDPTSPSTRDTPVLRSVRGVLKKAEITERGKHLAAKYR
ncbi:MAG: DUF6364 family protein [Bryobacteraceae bacterium]